MLIMDKEGKVADDGRPNLTIEAVLAEVNKALESKLVAKFDDLKKSGLGDAIKAQVEPLAAQLAAINEAVSKFAPQTGGQGEGNSGGGKSAVPPEVNAQLRQLTDQLKSQGTELQNLKVAKERAELRAEETERHSTIRTALNGLPFVNDKAADTAFSIVAPHVRRLDDGTLVAGIGGDNFPVESFTKDYLQKDHSYLFKPTGASGSGAPANTGGLRMGAKADINSIKVGMKADDRSAVVDSIAAALQGV